MKFKVGDKVFINLKNPNDTTNYSKDTIKIFHMKKGKIIDKSFGMYTLETNIPEYKNVSVMEEQIILERTPNSKILLKEE